jgi:ribose 5-phosphate isomerase B
MAMTANRYKNIRAVLCLNVDLARLAREHNDANVLVLAADFTDEDTAQKILEVFLNTKFLGGRYAERRDKLTDLGGL